MKVLVEDIRFSKVVDFRYSGYSKVAELSENILESKFPELLIVEQSSS